MGEEGGGGLTLLQFTQTKTCLRHDQLDKTGHRAYVSAIFSLGIRIPERHKLFYNLNLDSVL